MNQLTNSSVYVLPGIKRTINYILSLLGTNLKELKPYNRKGEINDKRQLAMSLIYRKSNKSLEQVGEIFARDHATVWHACHQIENRAFWDRAFKKQLSELLEKIRNYDLSD